MTSVQKILIRLLVEFGTICKAHGVEYCAIDRLAWDVTKFGRFHDKTYDAFVLVRKTDKEKLIVGLGDMRDVVVEECSGRSKGDLPWDLRVSSTSHSLIDLRVSPRARKYAVALSVKYLEELPDGRYSYVAPDDSALIADYDIVGGAVCQMFEGEEIPVPADRDRYFSLLVGPDWKDRTYGFPIQREGYGVIFMEDVPFDALLAKMCDMGVDVSALSLRVSRLLEWERSDCRPAQREVSRHDADHEVTVQRYRLCEKYLPCKSRLLAAWREGCYGQVCRALSDYLDTLKMFYAKGKIIHFDNELHNLALDALKYQKWTSVEDFQSMVPEGYFRSPLSSDAVWKSIEG